MASSSQSAYYDQLVKQYPWLAPFISESTSKINWLAGQEQPTISGAGSSATGFWGPSTVWAPKLAQAGYAGLGDILLNKGQTDPALMNRNLAAIDRGTQSEVRGNQGRLAQMGIQGSGVGAALTNAISQAGQDRKADYRASEADKAEARRRQDLDLFSKMVIQPNIDATALHSGQYGAAKDRQQQQDAANQAFWGQILNGLVGLF